MPLWWTLGMLGSLGGRLGPVRSTARAPLGEHQASVFLSDSACSKAWVLYLLFHR